MQLENSHGGLAGKSIVNVIQDSLDKGMADFQECQNDQEGTEETWNSKLSQLQGYVAGIAKALGILRGTSVKTEINESRERISERNKPTTEIIAGSVSRLGT